MNDLSRELRELMGTYARIVGTAMEGVQVMNTKILEAFEAGDVHEAQELIGVLDQNVGHWRDTFRL